MMIRFLILHFRRDMKHHESLLQDSELIHICQI